MNEVTVADALRAYRAANGIPAVEADIWACKVGPVMLELPNFAWRRKAILAHDLHHVLTEIPCTMGGECQMAAWEFGAGRMPHWGAALFCLPLAAIGALLRPRVIFAAFRDGRRSRSLHGTDTLENLLRMPLAAGRRSIRRG